MASVRTRNEIENIVEMTMLFTEMIMTGAIDKDTWEDEHNVSMIDDFKGSVVGWAQDFEDTHIDGDYLDTIDEFSKQKFAEADYVYGW